MKSRCEFFKAMTQGMQGYAKVFSNTFALFAGIRFASFALKCLGTTYQATFILDYRAESWDNHDNPPMRGASTGEGG